MKLFKENIFYGSNSLVVKEKYFAFNDFPFHYHPEFELIFILSGNGQRFIGDNIAEFKDDQLYFLGSNLPHTFYNKHIETVRKIHQVVVQFDEHFLGNNFFDKQAFKRIRSFLDNAKRGYCFNTDAIELVRKKMMQLVQLEESEVIIELLSILNILSRSNSFGYITSEGYNIQVNGKDSERIVEVYDFVYSHFKEEISLSQVASVACLSPEAFCRYFKKHTRKKFSEFLLEVRIGNACKLLQESKLSIGQISVDCGFNNMSYFNRVFKKFTQKTPADYSIAFTDRSFDVVHTEMFNNIPTIQINKKIS